MISVARPKGEVFISLVLLFCFGSSVCAQHPGSYVRHAAAQARAAKDSSLTGVYRIDIAATTNSIQS